VKILERSQKWKGVCETEERVLKDEFTIESQPEF
jgi:hypothetical protein